MSSLKKPKTINVRKYTRTRYGKKEIVRKHKRSERRS